MSDAPADFRGLWRSDADARAAYAEAAGIHQIVPAAVAVPADADDVAALVRWASEHRIALTARGSGSSMAGGAVGDGVIVDLSRLAYIGEVDTSARRVTAGPGAVCTDVDAAARRHSLRFPMDPSSARFCTVGGMAATNAAGARTLRFGQMNAWIQGIECVFSDGSRTWIRRDDPVPAVPALSRFASIADSLRAAERERASRHDGVRKESSGYALATWSRSGSLVDLLAGSEGTLALFTALELKLAPIPVAASTVIAAFPSIDAASRGAAIAAELNASACELLDASFLEIARRGGPLPVPDDADAVLLVELEADRPRQLHELTRAVVSAFSRAGAQYVEPTLDADRSTTLWRVRHAASPILASMSPALVSMQVIEDGAVPPGRLPDYVRGLRDVLARHATMGVLFGHAGDGHVHVNVLVDTSEHGWQARLDRIFADTVNLLGSLGGTTAGEHGDGRLRAAALERMWPPETVTRFRTVKDAFDPLGILNPGVKLPQAGAPPLGGPIKYDPSLAPLPAVARSVLDRVQRERAWSRSRLELLEEEGR